MKILSALKEMFPPNDTLPQKTWKNKIDYVIVEEIKDPRFGEIQLLKHKKSKMTVFAKEEIFTEISKAEAKIEILKKIKNSNSQFLLKLIDFAFFTEKSFCSKIFKVKLIFEFP